MKSKLRPHLRSIALVICLAVLAASTVWAIDTATATPPSGLTATPLASGNLPEAVHLALKTGLGGPAVATRVSQIMMVKYTVQPGGTFGWHQHGGPVWAIVAAGTLTVYEGSDRTCQPKVYTAPSTLLDEGTHTHIARNETNAPVEVYATFMLPAGGQPRIDVPDPGHCPF